MENSSLKKRLASGACVIGCFVTLPSPDVTEVLAYAGFDFLLLDQEHGPGTHNDAVAQMRAMGRSSTQNVIRVPACDPAYIKRILDAGAENILCPNIEDDDQARALVEACRYPPRGRRGAGGGVRAARYGGDATYYEQQSEDDRLIIVQIESPRGVENIERIAAVPGIDMLLIGPRDLSAAMGMMNKFDSPQLIRLVREAEQRILATGKYLASVIYPGSTAREMFARGYNLLIIGSDTGLLMQGARSMVESARPR